MLSPAVIPSVDSPSTAVNNDVMEGSLESASVTTEMNDKAASSQPLGVSRRCKILLGVATVLAVLGITLSSLYATGKLGGNGTQDSESSFNGDEVTEDVQKRFTMFRPILFKSNPIALSNPSSPQSKALGWLVTKDTTLVVENTTEEKILQRFAIITMYYACNGAEWLDDLSASTNECLLRGVLCNKDGYVMEIDWHDSKVTGQLPDEIGILTNLRSLNLGENMLKGTIPEVILTKLIRLEKLYLDRNEFSSTLSSNIANLRHLKEIYLNKNVFIGALPIEALSKLSQLKVVDISNNDLSGSVFSLLENWPNLEQLQIHFTSVSGTIPEDIGDLVPSLRLLEAWYNDLSGSIPSSIAKLTNLTHLSLRGPNITSPLPEFFGVLTNLEVLAFSTIAMDASTFPTELGLLTNLRELLVDGNSGLIGTIPSELENLVKLEILDLFANSLTGTVPSGLARLTNLVFIDLTENEGIAGSIDHLCHAEEIAYECSISCSCCRGGGCP